MVHEDDEREPKSQELVDSARLHAKGGAFTRALGFLDKALVATPRSPSLWIEMARVLAGKGDVDEAVEALDHALDLEPGHARAHFERGVLLTELGRTGEAILAFAASVELRPEFEVQVREALAIRPDGKFEIAVVRS